MTRIAIACTACQKPLAGGTDTFGDIWQPFCWECYAELNSGTPGQFRYLSNAREKLSEMFPDRDTDELIEKMIRRLKQ